jgi:hypothetical protein
MHVSGWWSDLVRACGRLRIWTARCAPRLLQADQGGGEGVDYGESCRLRRILARIGTARQRSHLHIWLWVRTTVSDLCLIRRAQSKSEARALVAYGGGLVVPPNSDLILDRATRALSRQGIRSYSPALAANVSTTAMFCSNSGGSPCRSCKYAGLL